MEGMEERIEDYRRRTRERKGPRDSIVDDFNRALSKAKKKKVNQAIQEEGGFKVC